VRTAYVPSNSYWPGCEFASAALLVDFDLHLDFNVSFDLGLQLNDGRPQWVVDTNFLANDFERDGERVACSCVSGS
jgi:hypothetical protein